MKRSKYNESHRREWETLQTEFLKAVFDLTIRQPEATDYFGRPIYFTSGEILNEVLEARAKKPTKKRELDYARGTLQNYVSDLLRPHAKEGLVLVWRHSRRTDYRANLERENEIETIINTNLL